jgi:hypothetical protein
MPPRFLTNWPQVRRWAVGCGYLGVVVLFFAAAARMYDSAAGFNYLISFGARQQLPQLPEMRSLNHLLQADGYGYDAQYYVQIAMRPSLRGEDLRHAIDGLRYRGRRILTCWTAYVAGFGQPAGILQAYAAQNFVAWLLLAVVLLRWFPPTDASNLLRWAGVLFCAGVCQSLRHALVDGPSLLLICAGVWAVETNRRWLATGVFAVSGLARETNLLAAAALVRPAERNWGHARELLVRALVIGTPLALWLAYIHWAVGPGMDTGLRNFNAPLLSYVTHWRHTIAAFAQAPASNPWPRINLLVMIALTVQFGFLVLRPRWEDAWWRVGVCFAGLMVVLGTAVWEGYPGAAPRVLLPMQMAFNVLVPRTKRWLPLLLLGNLSILGAPEFLQPPPGLGYQLTGATTATNGTASAQVTFDAGWYSTERRNDRYWRWARGDAGFTIRNPHATPATVALSFWVDGIDQRTVTIRAGDRVLWAGEITTKGVHISEEAFTLPPGDTVITLRSEQPPKLVGSGTEERPLAFSLRNLAVRFLPPATAP